MSESRVPGLLARRAVLAGTAATAALTAGPSWGGGGMDVPDRLGNDAVPLSDADLLAALVRLRGSVDGRVTAGWLESGRYAVIDGAASSARGRIFARRLSSKSRITWTSPRASHWTP